jgi:hypothetical protein
MLTDSQMAEARLFAATNLTTLSQAVKAFECGDTKCIQEWKNMLIQKENRKRKSCIICGGDRWYVETYTDVQTGTPNIDIVCAECGFTATEE